MIDPGRIPHYTGSVEELEKDHAALKKDGAAIRSAGAGVHSRFQGLSAFYQAPEAEQLFASTAPVKNRADQLGDDVETVASALSAYATEIRPLVKKLDDLRARAVTFVAEHEDDDDWQYDEDKVAEHNRIDNEAKAALVAFTDAERACYNKIVDLWGGPHMRVTEGKPGAHEYGFRAEDLKGAKMPWGTPVNEKHHPWEIGHWVKSFVWDGVVIDGIVGTLKGLGTLIGVNGWDNAFNAWKGLAQLATGVQLSLMPGAQIAFWALPDDKLPSWLRESRTTMKQTGKALVAWDEWGKNPGRAAGAVTFNVVTTVFTGGTGGAVSGAGKAGKAAQAAALVSKAGRVIDPMTYVAKAGGAGLAKISDISSSLRGINGIDLPRLPDNAVTLPEGSLRLPDGTVQLPDGVYLPEGAHRLPDGRIAVPENALVLPEGSVRLTDGPAKDALYLDPELNIRNAEGEVVHGSDHAPIEASPAPRTSGAEEPLRVDNPLHEAPLVGAGSRHLGTERPMQLGEGAHGSPEGPTRVGGEAPISASPRADRSGGSDLPQRPSAGHDAPGVQSDSHRVTQHTTQPEGQATQAHGGSGGGSHGNDFGRSGEPSIAQQVPDAGGNPHLTPDVPSTSPISEISPERYSTGHEASPPPSEPMRPEQEAGLSEALSRSRMPADDQAKVLRTLRKERFGAKVADLISRGHLEGIPNYDEILNMCKQGSSKSQKGMIPAAHMALREATILQNKGFSHLAFEIKDEALDLDLDVAALRPDGTPQYGYQLKDVDSIEGIRSAAKKAAKQLISPSDTTKFAILDVHRPRAELSAKMFNEVEFQARRAGATFQLRFEDGSITVPADRPNLP
ncbi:hypothetical protein [Streptomyces physcomitrii]|uniref:Tox-REase-7 domain-containing protein n=1 Tax=Streptomyces physcomitrii TaxID=2724184 RepID=A0ABX1H853_9ACTN|nr:hypothetical protein [Streptomyces physcomitrii]NKI44562.1 hypothetical protein [Streptomyces physcomitrii]